METNIDDMTGELAGYVMETLLDQGALDVFYTPIYMKKNRPAIQLSVLCREESREDLQQIIFEQTTTLGIRMYKAQRFCMEREFIKVNTPYGVMTIKKASYGTIVKYTPEYEECKQKAKITGQPLHKIYQTVLDAIHHKNTGTRS